MRRPIERQRLGIEQVRHHVWIRAQGSVEGRARPRRVAIDAKLPQQTAERPQRFEVVFVLGEQHARVIAHAALQQGGEQEVSHAAAAAWRPAIRRAARACFMSRLQSIKCESPGIAPVSDIRTPVSARNVGI